MYLQDFVNTLQDKDPVISLIRYYDRQKELEKDISNTLDIEFQLVKDFSLEDIILDLLHFPDEREGGNYSLSCDEAKQLDLIKNTNHYGFCRKKYVDIILRNDLIPEKKFDLLKEELNNL